jgi:hypothetical protein
MKWIITIGILISCCSCEPVAAEQVGEHNLQLSHKIKCVKTNEWYCEEYEVYTVRYLF